MSHRWRFHPAVRTDSDLSFGERAADRMKGVFATWTALGLILAAMAVWLVTGGFGADPAPFILLNLCLSCLAALQCFILLIAAKRTDQVSAELAAHGYQVDLDDAQVNKEALDQLVALRTEHAKLADTLARLHAVLAERP